METTERYHQIKTPRMAVSRKLARMLAFAINVQPGDIVEVNTRETTDVTSTFTDELVIALLDECQASQILVRGTVPGMFSGIKASSLEHGFRDDQVGSIPVSQRPRTEFI